MRARLLTSIALAVCLGILATPAAAETRPPPDGGEGGAYLSDDGDPTAVAADGGSSPGQDDSGGGGGSGDGPPCHWEVVVDDDSAFAIYDVDSLEPQHSQTGRWLQYVCDGLGPVAVGGQYLVPEGGPAVDPAELAAEALASIEIGGPAIRTSPAAEGRLYVRIPTWLWLDGSWWQTYQATATAGQVTSTVSARPMRTSWSMGDGSTVTCTGSGKAWRPGLPDDATDCSHTYRSSSAGRTGGTFTITATVAFEVTWSSNTGSDGALPTIDRSSTVGVDVGEIQAIGTSRGGRSS